MKFKKIVLTLFALTTSAVASTVALSSFQTGFAIKSESKISNQTSNVLKDEEYITVGNWQIDETNRKLISNDDNRFQYDVAFEGNATNGYSSLEVNGFEPLATLTKTEAFYIDFSNVLNLNENATFRYYGYSDKTKFDRDPLTGCKCHQGDGCLYSYKCVGFNTGKITYGDGLNFSLAGIHNLKVLEIGPKLPSISAEEWSDYYLGGLISLQEIKVNNNSDWIVAGDINQGQQLYSIQALPTGETVPVLGRDKPLVAWGKVYVPLHSGSTEVLANFEDQSAITEVEFQEGITVLNETVFKRCYNLKNVNFPTSLQVMNNETNTYTFARCPNLTNVYFPDNLHEIFNSWPDDFFESYAFEDDSNLKTIKYGSSLNIDESCPNRSGDLWLRISVNAMESFLPENIIFGSNVTATNNFSVFIIEGKDDNFSKFIDYYKNHPINIIFEGSIDNINFSDANSFLFKSSSDLNNFDLSAIHTNLIFNNSQQAENFANTYPQYLNNPQRYSSIQIVTSPSVEINNKNNNLIDFIAGSDFSKQFTATTNPNIEIPEKIYQNWLIQFTGNVQPSWYSFDSKTGLLELNNNFLPGNYDYTIKCNYVGLSNTEVFDTMQGTIVCNYQTPQLGNITLTGDGVSGNNINLTYGEPATIQATCPILNEANVDPNIFKYWEIKERPYRSIQIDSTTGEITIPANTPAFTNEPLEIVYYLGGLDSNAVASQTLIANLTISYTNPVLGDITLTKSSGDATITGNTINQVYGNISTFNASCNINNNANIDPSLPKTWSINSAPIGVSIDGTTGLMTINNPNYGNNQAINVVYTVGTITKTQNYTLNVAYATPIFSDLTLQGNGVVDNSHINLLVNQSSTVTASCEITNQPNIDPSFSKTWSLKNQPSGVSINTTTGAITIPDTLAINSYDLTIVCGYGSSARESIVTLTIMADYQTPNLSNISISNANNVTIVGNEITIPKNQSASFQAICQIINIDDIDPSLVKTWSINNAPSGVSINSTNGIVTINQQNGINNQVSLTVTYAVGTVSQQANLILKIEGSNDNNSDSNSTILIATIVPTVCAIIIIALIVIYDFFIKKNKAKKTSNI